MALHTHKRRMRVGLPEVVAAVLIALATVMATMWWRDANLPEWAQAEGRILECAIRDTHYNAEDYRPKVTVGYEYNVGTTRHTGSFAGFWPLAKSANALPPSRYGELKSRAFGLIVFYDPQEPGVEGENPEVAPGRSRW